MEDNNQKAPLQPCSCGRVYTHCRACGTRNPYIKKKRSAELSFELGKRVWAFSCTKCPQETHSEMPCQAPPVDTGEGFEYVKASKPTELPPWGHSAPGTVEHYGLLTQWVEEMQKKKSWGPVKVYVEAQKTGWHLEAYPDIDEDVKNACLELGIWPVPESGVSSAAVSPQVQVMPSGPVQESVALDDIIKAMQEEQK